MPKEKASGWHHEQETWCADKNTTNTNERGQVFYFFFRGNKILAHTQLSLSVSTLTLSLSFISSLLQRHARSSFPFVTYQKPGVLSLSHTDTYKLTGYDVFEPLTRNIYIYISFQRGYCAVGKVYEVWGEWVLQERERETRVSTREVTPEGCSSSFYLSFHSLTFLFSALSISLTVPASGNNFQSHFECVSRNDQNEER